MPQLNPRKRTSIRKPIGSRLGEPGFVGIRAETRFEGIRRRLIPTRIFEKAQEALGTGEDLITVPTGEFTEARVRLSGMAGVGARAFAFNSPTFRLLKFIKTIKRAAGKRAFTNADKVVLKKLMKQEDILEKSIGKFNSNRIIKFLDPIRGAKPPSNFDLPNLKNIGELKKMAKSAEFRGKLDVVRKKLKRPSIDIQAGKPIRDIEQRAAGTGKPSELPPFARAEKLKRRAQKIREAVRRTFGKRKKE